MDGTGVELDVLAYDEYGTSVTDDYALKTSNPFGFVGYGISDFKITGNYFAQAREYSPDVGRFMSEDLIKGFAPSPSTLNHYSYCWNQPIGLVDLDGLFPRECDYEKYPWQRPIDDGHHAEEAIRKHLSRAHPGQIIPRINVERPSIPNAGPSGRRPGEPDIVFVPGLGRPHEIFEVKGHRSYGPGRPGNAEAIAQINRYVNNYERLTGVPAVHGESFNIRMSINSMPPIPSRRYPDRMIEFVTYHDQPGLIFWRYQDQSDDDRGDSNRARAIARIGAAVAAIAALSNYLKPPSDPPSNVYPFSPRETITPPSTDEIVAVGGLAAIAARILSAKDRALNGIGSFFLFTEEQVQEHLCNSGFAEFCSGWQY